MGVQLEDPQFRNRRSEHFHYRKRRGVITPQHDGDEAGLPERADLFPGSRELFARRARAELAVAEIGHLEVFEIAVEGGRVSLDRVGGDPELARPMIGSPPEVDRAFEGNAEDDVARLGIGWAAGDEAWIGRL